MLLEVCSAGNYLYDSRVSHITVASHIRYFEDFGDIVKLSYFEFDILY